MGLWLEGRWPRSADDRGTFGLLGASQFDLPVYDDAQLIAETLSGKSAAFGQLVQKYQDRLYNTMVHVVGNAEDALDIVQEAMVQAFLKLESFHQASAFYTWLYRIAFNVAASQRRRRRPTTSVEQAYEASGTEPVDGQVGPSNS